MQLHYSIILAIVTLLVLGTGCALIAPALTPTPFVGVPSPTVTQGAPTPTSAATTAPVSSSAMPTLPPSPPTPAPTGALQPQANRISFPAGGTSVTLQGSLTPNGIDRYVLRALAGQTMTLNFAPSADNLTIQVSGADGSVLVSGGAKVSTWSGALPTTQDYFIGVISNAAASATYTLQVTILPLGATAVPDEPRRITFPPGGTTATLQGATAAPGQDRFVIRALAGQKMSVNILSTQGPAILIIYGADGDVLISDHAGATSWSGQLRTTQDYFIDTRSVGSAVVAFSLTVTIPPLGAEEPTPAPKRIVFPPGGTTVTVQSALPIGQMDRWVLRALAGQTMTVNSAVTQGQVILIIWGVQDGNVLISDHAGATSWTGQLPTTEDYYIDVRSVGTAAANYALQVTISPK